MKENFNCLKRFVISASAALLVISPSSAESDSAGYLTTYLDNDLFGGTDANYTNGARISYITEGNPVINVPFVQNVLRRFSAGEESIKFIKKIWGATKAEEAEYSHGFALTQLMFTPTTLEGTEPPPGERPYAGWLGVGFSLHLRDDNKLNSVELSIGTTGQNSFAKESQDLVHDVRGLAKFDGWDSQIPGEPTFNLSFNQRRRGKFFSEINLPFDLEIDGFYDNGYDVGTFLTAAHVGAMVRVGWNIPVEFSDPRLTLSAHSQKLYSEVGKNKHDWSGYGLFGMRGSAVLHDMTLDGSLFTSYDTGVDKRSFVGEYYLGFGIRYRHYELGYVHTYRTRQFESQGVSQSFGSVALRIGF